MSEVRKNTEKVVRTGRAATYHADLVASTNNYVVRNPGNVILHFKKSGAGNCNVILVTPKSVDGLAITDRTVTVPATTGDLFIGPFPPDIYNNANGDIDFTVSEVTGLTLAVLQIE
jgi:hypothetical protein